jgi:hypothetical protein
MKPFNELEILYAIEMAVENFIKMMLSLAMNKTISAEYML